MKAIRVFGIAALVAASVSCGSVVREGGSPVYLVIDSLQAIRGGSGSTTPSGFLISDVITNVTQPPPCSTTSPCPTVFDDTGQAVLRAPLKDIGTQGNPLSPTTNNEVTINRVHIEYVRSDGRNVPGVDVPYAFDAAATGTILASSTLTLNFEIVRHAAKEESPLVQLRTGGNIINTITKVTFYGQDRVGNAVQASGQIQINFGNFGDSQ